MSKSNNISLLLLIIISIFFLSAMQSCNDTEKIKKSIIENQSDDLPDQIMYKLSVDFIDSNRVKATLTGEKARIYNERKETWIDSNVYIEFYSKVGNKKESYLKADSARIDDRTKNMYAFGNVIVVKNDSSETTLTTNALEWNQKDQKLYSNEFTKIESPIEIIEGYGFESDQSLQNYKIFRVSGEKK